MSDERDRLAFNGGPRAIYARIEDCRNEISSLEWQLDQKRRRLEYLRSELATAVQVEEKLSEKITAEIAGVRPLYSP